MNSDDDQDMTRQWRGVSAGMPGSDLDARILAAARGARRRRALVPLGALLAACLVLAFALARQAQPPAPLVVLDTSTFGLYEGRGMPIAADGDATQQALLRQQPGGAIVTPVVRP